MPNMRVLREDRWRTWERKALKVQIFDEAGQPLNLSSLSQLRYQLRREAGGTVLLEKTRQAGEITIEDAVPADGDQSVAVIAIDEGDVAKPRKYWHAMRDDEAGVMLGEDTAEIAFGIEPQESP